MTGIPHKTQCATGGHAEGIKIGAVGIFQHHALGNLTVGQIRHMPVLHVPFINLVESQNLHIAMAPVLHNFVIQGRYDFPLPFDALQKVFAVKVKNAGDVMRFVVALGIFQQAS